MFIYHIIFCLSLFFDQHFLPSAVFVPSTLEDVQIRKKNILCLLEEIQKNHKKNKEE